MNKLAIPKKTIFLIKVISIIFIGQFLYHTIQSSFSTLNLFWGTSTLAIAVLTFIGLHYEFDISKEIQPVSNSPKANRLIKSILIVLINTILAFAIASIFKASSIFAASLICVISAYIFPLYEAEAYSGSIGGMIGLYLCSNWIIALLVGAVTGITFIFFLPYFKGIGGRGGSISYVATMISVRMLLSLNPEQRTPIELELVLPSLIAIIIAAFMTYMLHKHQILTIIKSAMLISLIASILVPISYYTITIAIFTGTVVGTSMEHRIKNYAHLAVISIICFILFVPSFHIQDGIGGKLGILSLIAYEASIGLKIIIQDVTSRFFASHETI